MSYPDMDALFDYPEPKDLPGGFEHFLNLEPSVHLRPMQKRADSLPLAHLEEK